MTRMSKGVILTHKNFTAMSLMVTADQDRHDEPRNMFMCFIPMFHVLGLSMITYSQLRRGNMVVSIGKFEFYKVLGAAEKYRVTHLYVVPSVMILLAKHSVVKKYNLSSLKRIRSSAASLGMAGNFDKTCELDTNTTRN
jgi:4-coumarate--CoA ligase